MNILGLVSLRGPEGRGNLMFGPNGKRYFVYLLTNKWNSVLYTGVTNDLKRRVFEHKEKMADGFTKKYEVHKLVHYEIFDDPESAIKREKQIKAGSRGKKNQLVESMNPEWRDLYDEIQG